MSNTATTTTFQAGNTYYCRSAVDHDTIWTFDVVKRSAKFLTIADQFGKISRVGVKVSNGEEWAKPMGSYSMCPVIRPDRGPLMETQRELKFRAQALAMTSPMRWVDGGTFGAKVDAEADAAEMKRLYATYVRVIEVA